MAKRGRKKKRGRPRGSKNRIIKITIRHRNIVKVKCIICKRQHKIRINKRDFDLYTEELKKNYVCLLCKNTWKHKLLKKGLIKIGKKGKVIHL